MLIGAGSDADRRAKLLIHLAAERSLLDAYSHAGLVNEVKACTIYCRAGMVELIEMALLCPTVTSGAPVGDQVSKISRFNSVGPSGDPYVRWQRVFVRRFRRSSSTSTETAIWKGSRIFNPGMLIYPIVEYMVPFQTGNLA
jgi:hypothetical protein